MGTHAVRTLTVIAVLWGSLVAGCATSDTQKPAHAFNAGGMLIKDPVLVTPETNAGSLSAKVYNRTGRQDEITGVSATRGGKELYVFQSFWGGWENLAPGKRRMLGLRGEGDPYVVRGVKPGETVQVTISFKRANPLTFDAKVVADGPKYSKVAAYPLPTVTDGRVVVVSGHDCAYVGFTIDGHGAIQRTLPQDVSVQGPDGHMIDWKHQTATGGPADIVAMETPTTIDAKTDDLGCNGKSQGGDADYVDASAVKVGEIVQVSFEFPAGVVTVPFRVVAG